MKTSTLLIICFFFCLIGAGACIVLGVWFAYNLGKWGEISVGALPFMIVGGISIAAHHDTIQDE